ncbi:hypothetical protein BOTBODRAFT_34477 [Botryobasidium botryosum FD-172 SS1]|uniref:Zn(2)-C6 fungal-type domain-containing protein n=1 Tax=Botryobasidium botryosum (strain FD-172 SS1) TaxID=930990 RepID=A0A067M9R5_BOTB1|nr:hypothetical protein BOTBODRAFT_34477 [Botryobasidium botryosum FD-172 SS1]
MDARENLDGLRSLSLIPRTACLQCRRKKKKCDAVRPECGTCTKIRKKVGPCTYDVEPLEHTEIAKLVARITSLQGNVRVLEDLRRITASPSRATSAPQVLGYGEALCTGARGHRGFSLTSSPDPLEGPASLKDPIVRMLRQKYMPSNIRDQLISAFMKQGWLYFAEWNTQKFWHAYKLPPSHPEAIHPALLDAMCLIACLNNPQWARSYERLFYERLHRSLYECLANADRLLDFIRASTLRAAYCSIKGSRLSEAQANFPATLRFAMACGLHQIETYDLTLHNTSPLLKQPTDLVDLGDMIYAWWSIYTCDRFHALLTGNFATVNDQTVTTMWPCALRDYIDGNVPRSSHSSRLGALRSPNYDFVVLDSVHHNPCAFRVQSIAMLYHAAVLATDFREGKDVGYEAEVAIQVSSHLADSMVAYRQRVCPTFDRARCTESLGHDSTLIAAMSMMYAALIQLLNIFADQDAMYERRLQIARECAYLAVEVCSLDPNLLHTSIWLPWTSAYEVLLWESLRPRDLGTSSNAFVIRTELDQLTDAFEMFAQHFFPVTRDWPFRALGRFDIQTNAESAQII